MIREFEDSSFFPFLQYFDEFSFVFHKLTEIFCLPAMPMSKFDTYSTFEKFFLPFFGHTFSDYERFYRMNFVILSKDFEFVTWAFVDVLIFSEQALWRRARVGITIIVTRFIRIKTKKKDDFFTEFGYFLIFWSNNFKKRCMENKQKWQNLYRNLKSETKSYKASIQRFEKISKFLFDCLQRHSFNRKYYQVISCLQFTRSSTWEIIYNFFPSLLENLMVSFISFFGSNSLKRYCFLVKEEKNEAFIIVS